MYFDTNREPEQGGRGTGRRRRGGYHVTLHAGGSGVRGQDEVMHGRRQGAGGGVDTRGRAGRRSRKRGWRWIRDGDQDVSWGWRG